MSNEPTKLGSMQCRAGRWQMVRLATAGKGKEGGTLTVEPFGVVLDGALEWVHLLAGAGVEKVRAEDDRVCLAVLRHRATVEAGQIARVAFICKWPQETSQFNSIRWAIDWRWLQS